MAAWMRCRANFLRPKRPEAEHFQLDRLQIPDVLGDGHQPNRKDLYLYIIYIFIPVIRIPY